MLVNDLVERQVASKAFHTIFQWLEGLFAWLTNRRTKDKSGLQLPSSGNDPCARNVLLDKITVMLKIGSKTFLSERDPQIGGVNTMSMLAPRRKHSTISRNGLL